jgi:3-oxoacyl-[acyl-carrier-protein] synthase-3
MDRIFSRIVGTGSYLPRSIWSNADVATKVNTTDLWIRTMTGIRQRHVATPGESTTDMAAAAGAQALKAASLDATQLDLIIVATITPDLIFPSTAAMVQARLKARHIGAFDLSAACSGFLNGLAIADGMIAAGRSKAALVIGAERMTNLLDWTERSTCVLFGDGAAAVAMVPSSMPGIMSAHMHADGSSPDLLRAPSKATPYLHMDGGAVFKFAVRSLVEGGHEALKANHMTASNLDWVIPHQANLRIIEVSAKKLEIPIERVIVTVDKHANTSAASIPLALDDAVQSGKITSGDNVLLLSVGGGFTWASCMIRWG